MVKWADYLISGVWLSEAPRQHVTHVMLHADNITNIGPGEKYTVQDVISLIDSGFCILTVRWDYAIGSWIKGDVLDFELINGKKHLRTKTGHNFSDSLDYLIDMTLFPVMDQKFAR